MFRKESTRMHQFSFKSIVKMIVKLKKKLEMFVLQIHILSQGSEVRVQITFGAVLSSPATLS
jgi:hypothetical protein